MKKTLTLVVLLSVLGGCVPQSGAQTLGGRIGGEQAKTLLAASPTPVLIDVRTPEEYAGGHIPGAALLPFNQITPETAAAFIPDKSTPVVLYCRSGNRSGQASRTLAALGYQVIYDLGPVSAWPGELRSGDQP